MSDSLSTYVSNLSLPNIKKDAALLRMSLKGALRSSAALAEAPDVPSAALIKGQVTAFTAGISGQDKQDVECTTLAAQLNSDVVVKNNQTYDGMQAWFKNYATVMSNFGWIMSFEWEKYNASSAGLSMDAVLIEVLAAVASQNGAAIAKAAVDAVKKLPKDGDRLKLFSNATLGDHAGKFLLGVASKENEAISLAYGAFAMDYQTRDTTVLWFNWKSSNVSIYKDQKSATFNQKMYANKARSALEARLSDHIKLYVETLDLGF